MSPQRADHKNSSFTILFADIKMPIQRSSRLTDRIALYLFYIWRAGESLRRVTESDIRDRISEAAGNRQDDTEIRHALTNLISRSLIEVKAGHYCLTGQGYAYAHDLFNERRQTSGATSTANKSLGCLFLLLLILLAALFLSASGVKASPQRAIQFSQTPLQLGSSLQFQSPESYLVPVPSNPWHEGIQFALSPSTYVLESESQSSGNPAQIRLPLWQTNVTALHLLMNLSYGAPRYTDGQAIAGRIVAQVLIKVDGKEELLKTLVAGKDIREWVIGSEGVVSTISPEVKPAWEGRHRASGAKAVIDHIVVPMPAQFQGKLIEEIIIQDLSIGMFGSRNPGLLIFAITVEHGGA